jgi:uncharacterized protein
MTMPAFNPFRTCLAILILAVAPFSRCFAQQISSPTDVVQPINPLQVFPFPLQDVQLLPGPFYDAMLRDETNLLAIDPDRQLYSFRANYNLSTSNAVPYGGWEGPTVQLRGHIMGHYLSAASLMYASTGNPALKAHIDYLVGELAKCQAAATNAGYRAGYLSAFPENYIDIVITNGSIWAPWYTIHKIMAGLLDAYQVEGNTQALTVLTNEANWVVTRVSPLGSNQLQTMLLEEYGGMEEVMANVYAVTGNTNYLNAARDFDQSSLFTPLAAQQDVLNPLHINTQIPKIIGACREYEMTGIPSYLTIASFFWTRVTQYRSWAIGVPGDNEYFFPTNTFPQHMSAATAETCNAYNLEKLTRYLYAMNPDPHYMDYYEQTLFDDILASQEPNEGMVTYLMSLKPGHFKTYSTPDDSFWCCVGTGMENHSKYGDTIYFHDTNNTLYVNLFIASQLSWPQKGLTVRQDTTFPQTNSTLLTFSCTSPVPMTLKIRYPDWATSGMTVTLNGVVQSLGGSPDTYVSLTRTWTNGDQVAIQCPMSLWTMPLPDGTGTNTVAMFYGPILLAGALGTYQMPPTDYAIGQADLLAVPDIPVPAMICNTNGFIANTLPVPGQPLTFQTTNIGAPYDVRLIPFYETQHQRYTVYWQLSTQAQLQQTYSNLASQDASDVDVVLIGNSTSESAHNLQSSNSGSGTFDGRNWRDASGGGWFSYVMTVQSNQPMTLDCTFWGSDSGSRVFDIEINGTIIGTETLQNDDPGVFFDVLFAIPTNLTTGKSQVTVRFQAHSGDTAGGIFGLQMENSLNPGSLQSISLTTQPTQPATGAASYQYAQVTANYQNLAGHSITNSTNLILLTSDPTVLMTGPNAQIMSVGPGTATITAYYLGFSASQTITVISNTANIMPATLRHRYTFSPANIVNGSNIIDSLNPSNPALYGSLQGNARITGQGLVLDGTTNTFANLPPGLISNYDGVTVEVFASFGNEANWAYLFAFGDTVSGAGQNGFWFTPHSGDSDYRLILSQISGQANEYRVTALGYLDGFSDQDIVAEIDLDNGSYEALYVDGSLVGSVNNVPFTQSAVHDSESYIGKSAYVTDPTFIGTVSEVRIYEGRMSASEAAASYALGANALLSQMALTVQSGISNVVISWPANSAGFALQSSSALGPQAAWTNAPETPQPVGNTMQVTLPPANASRFFRLSR